MPAQTTACLMALEAVFTITLEHVTMFRHRFQSAQPLFVNASLQTKCCFDAKESENAGNMPGEM